MIKKIILFSSISVMMLILTQCTTTGKYPDELDKLVPGSSFIFKGKVILLHTATTDEKDVTNTGVVLVTEVIDAPEFLQNVSGQQVTVRFTEINKVNVGEERMFFTEPYWIGETLGVTEIGSLLKSDKLYESKEILTYIKQAREKQADEQLGKILKDSRTVIAGKVLKISEPEGKVKTATEHDPEWKEAEIQIDQTLKGKIESKTVKILFASGKDVMFFQAPKFKEGDEGIFIIQQTDPQTLKLLRNENMIMDPLGFVKGKENTKRIETLLK